MFSGIGMLNKDKVQRWAKALDNLDVTEDEYDSHGSMEFFAFVKLKKP